MALVLFAIQKSTPDHLVAENLVEATNINFVTIPLFLTGLFERIEVKMHGNVFISLALLDYAQRRQLRLW